MEAAAAPKFTSDAFKSAFGRLQSVLVKEWPSIDREALAATGGDLDHVVELIVQKGQLTQALVRQKIEELHAMSANPSTFANIDERLREALDRIEKRTNDLADEVRNKVIPAASEKVKENLLVSLLVALGLGFILGILFGFGVRRDK